MQVDRDDVEITGVAKDDDGDVIVTYQIKGRGSVDSSL